jgi:hypothetical protein
MALPVPVQLLLLLLLVHLLPATSSDKECEDGGTFGALTELRSAAEAAEHVGRRPFVLRRADGSPARTAQ